MPSDELIDAVIEHVDNTLARYGLRTYTARCDQLAELAEVAVKDSGCLEAEVRRLELKCATLQATLDDTVELAEELLKHA